MTLDQHYHRHHLSFDYPSAWELVEDADDGLVSVSLFGDGTLWMITVLPRRPQPVDVISQTVAAFREEYGEIDLYPGDSTPESCAAALEFFALELVNWVWLRAFTTGGKTMLVQAQGTDHEREKQEPVLTAVTASLRLDPDEEIELE